MPGIHTRPVHANSTSLALLAASLVAFPALAGPLTPPTGPVAPTHRTQAEPRIPVGPETTPGNPGQVYVITQPGSYYLTGDIAAASGVGILIAADHVTLDLCGFTVSTAGLNDGDAAIYVDTAGRAGRGIVIRNGTVKGGGYACIALGGSEGARVEGISAVAGATGTGIYGALGSLITGCTVSGGYGGIYAAYGSIIEGCTVTGTANRGITVYGSTVRGCSVSALTGHGSTYGIVAMGDCLIEDNRIAGTGVSLFQVAVQLSGHGNRVEENQVASIRTGIIATTGSTENFVVRNTVRDCDFPFSYISSANAFAPVITSAGANFNATNPFSNFAW